MARVNEIVTTQSRDNGIFLYSMYFDESVPRHPIVLGTTKYGSLNFAWAEHEGSNYLGILDGDRLVALMIIASDRFNVPQIELTETLSEYRMQGLQRYMLSQAVNKFGAVFSDDHQTPEAQAFWQQLIKAPGTEFKITAHRTPDMEEVELSNSIWGDSDKIILKASKKGPTKESIIREDYRLKQGYNPTWFGPGCNVY